jgi:replicative DNA helicase
VDTEQLVTTTGNRQLIYEQMLVAASYGAPEYVLKTCGWVTPDLFSDPDLARYWADFLQDHNAVRAALAANVYARITQWQTYAAFSDASEYANKLAEQNWLARHIAPQMARVAQALQAGDTETVRLAVAEMAHGAPISHDAIPTAHQVAAKFKAMLEAGVPVVKTHIPKLDRALGGLEKRCQTLLAARPGTGKTALGLQIGREVAAGKRKVLFFSLEMADTQVWARMACGTAGIDWRKVKANEASKAELQQLMETADLLASVYGEYLLIDDRGHTVDSLWQAVANEAPELVIVDHVALLKDVDRQGNETHRLDRITQRTKQMAKDLDVALLVLCQLNREMDKRTDHIPQLSDLRDSGGLEQNADVVLMPYRPDLYEKWNGQTRDVVKLDIWVRKERSGEVNAKIELEYDLRQQWFYGKGER